MITAYLNQTVTLQRQGAVDRYGQPTFTSVTLPARVQQRMKMIRTSEGDQVVSDATVFLRPDVSPAPQVRDRVVFNGKAYAVLAVQAKQGLTGPTHLVLYLGGA
jgi:hypothetical protein